MSQITCAAIDGSKIIQEQSVKRGTSNCTNWGLERDHVNFFPVRTKFLIKSSILILRIDGLGGHH